MPKFPLTFYERQQIEYYLRCKLRVRKIAQLLHRDHSVISREIERNKGQCFPYNAVIAQRAAERRARITNTRKLAKNERLREYVEQKLQVGWSPQQIAGRLKYHPPPSLKDQHVCHETIYSYVYDKKGDGQWLYHFLPQQQPKRRQWYSRRPRHLFIPGRTPIQERPKVVEKRQRFGDWEADLVVFGRQPAAVAVQYERKSQLLRLTKVANRTANETADAIMASVESLPAQLWRTITLDNGGENVGHIRIKDQYSIQTYFCDPYKSWQKGGVENMNGLIRRYLPRKTTITQTTDEHIRAIQEMLNNRPRKGLQYSTPNEIINHQIVKMVH